MTQKIFWWMAIAFAIGFAASFWFGRKSAVRDLTKEINARKPEFENE